MKHDIKKSIIPRYVKYISVIRQASSNSPRWSKLLMLILIDFMYHVKMSTTHDSSVESLVGLLPQVLHICM